jgi:hypothetical protein
MALGIVITLVILALGLFTVGISLSFMVKPTEVKLGFIRPLSVATTYASVAGVVTGLAIALARIAGDMQGSGTIGTARFLGGVSEALIPSILGFSLLTMAWVAVSFGMRKHI